MRFKVIENQTYEAGRFEDKIEALEFARNRHEQHTDRYHEVYRFSPTYGWIGQAQWKPGDCEHQRLKEKCPRCNPRS